MIVRISATAAADLEEIADWIARDDPIRADSFVDELIGRCRSLADQPNRFPWRVVLRAVLCANSSTGII